jgi:hypothetical protein
MTNRRTLASIEAPGWASPADITFAQDPQGLGVVSGLSARQVGDLASQTDKRAPRQNDGRRHRGGSAERHVCDGIRRARR